MGWILCHYRAWKVLNFAKCNSFVWLSLLTLSKFLHLKVLVQRFHETLLNKVLFNHESCIFDKTSKTFPSWLRVILPFHFELNLVFILYSGDPMTNDTLNLEPATLFWLFRWILLPSLAFITPILSRFLLFRTISLHTSLSNRLVQVYLLNFVMNWHLIWIAALRTRWLLNWTTFLLDILILPPKHLLLLRKCGFTKFDILEVLISTRLLLCRRLSWQKSKELLLLIGLFSNITPHLSLLTVILIIINGERCQYILSNWSVYILIFHN